MNELKRTRNGLEDLFYSDLPESVYSPDQRCQEIVSIMEGIRAAVSLGFFESDLFQLLVRFVALQENSTAYFELERELISLICPFLLVEDEEIVDQAKFLKLVVSLKELVKHQKRQPASTYFFAVAWEPVMGKIFFMYAYSQVPSNISSAGRAQIIEELLNLLKELIVVNRPLALIEFVITKMLAPLRFESLSAVDTMNSAFYILGCFHGEDLLPFLANAGKSQLWIFFKRAYIEEKPTWFSPRAELYLLTVIAKFDGRQWKQLLNSGAEIVDHLRIIFSLSFDFIGIPASATKPGAAADESRGMYTQAGVLSNKLRVMGKLSKVIVSLVHCSEENELSRLAWRFLELLSARSQFILLASISERNAKWPSKLCDIYSSLVHHWLRRKLKHDFFETPVASDSKHARFLNLFMPGVVNVVKNALAGGVGQNMSSRYISIFVNLQRIAETSRAEEELAIARETLCDVHKSNMHAAVVLAGILPFTGLVSRLDTSCETLEFLLEYAIESIDASNLAITVSSFAFLDVLFTQIQHGWTLRDISHMDAGQLGDKSKAFINVSSCFPDWACRFFDTLLRAALNLPKPNVLGSAQVVAALSSEGLEVIGRALSAKVFSWVVFNVDDSVRMRFSTILTDFISLKLSDLSADPDRSSLIGTLLTILCMRAPDSEVIPWLLSKISTNEQSLLLRSNTVFISLAGHAVRYSGDSLLSEARLPRIKSILREVFALKAAPSALKKAAIKLFRRTIECVAQTYIMDQCSYSPPEFENAEFLLERVGKSPIDVQSQWWSFPSSVKFHCASEEGVKVLLPFIRLFLDQAASGTDSDLFLRLCASIGRGIRQCLVLLGHSDIYSLQSEIVSRLLRVTPTTETDLKTTSLWLKAVRFALPHPGANTHSAEMSGIIREMSGFRIENLVEFGYIGKEFEELDETRFEYINSKLKALLKEVESIRAANRTLDPFELDLLRLVTKFSIHSRFDKVKASCLSVLKNVYQVHPAGSENSRISGIVAEDIFEVLKSGTISRESAKGVDLVLNFCPDLGLSLLSSVGSTVKLFSCLATLMTSKSAADPEVMDALLGILRHLWTDRLRKNCDADQCWEEAAYFVRSFSTVLVSDAHLYWKSQVGLLIMVYAVWRLFLMKKPSVSEQLMTVLASIVERIDQTSSAIPVSRFVVFFIQVLVQSAPERVRPLVTEETRLGIAKIFSLNPRFQTKPSRVQLEAAEALTSLIIADELESVEYSQRSIPKLSNKGIVETNVMLWKILMAESSMESLLPILNKAEGDEEAHCTLLEVVAAIFPHDSDACMKFTMAEIKRGDGFLIPTIATVVRIGLVGLSKASLLPEEHPSGSMLVKRTFEYFLDEFEKCDKSSLVKQRLLQVIHSSILTDSVHAKSLSLQKFGQYLTDIVNRVETPEQVRDSAEICLARVVSFDASSAFTAFFRERDISDSSGSLDKSCIRITAHLIKLSQRLPDWTSNTIQNALHCATNPKNEIKREASSFLALVSRYISKADALNIVPPLTSYPKGQEYLIGLLVESTIIGMTKPESILWSCAETDFLPNVKSGFVDPAHSALFSRASQLRVCEASDLTVITAAKNALVDLCVATPSVDDLDAQTDSFAIVVALSSKTAAASLFYDVPQWGVKAVEQLASSIARGVSSSLYRVAEDSLSGFLKYQTDRGTRAKTERLIDSDVLPLVRASKNRHSYIS